jgi:hypothetical protein
VHFHTEHSRLEDFHACAACQGRALEAFKGFIDTAPMKNRSRAGNH